MRKRLFKFKGAILLATIFLFGCSHVWHPGNAPEIALETLGKFDGSYSVALINDQPDKELRLFGGAGGHKHFANYNEWTEFFISTYTKELQKRGVIVSNDSPNRILVKLDSFLFVQGFAIVRTNMKLRLSTSDNSWSKEFNETDASGWSMGRAFGSLIYHTIEKLMRDEEVINRMKS